MQAEGQVVKKRRGKFLLRLEQGAWSAPHFALWPDSGAVFSVIDSSERLPKKPLTVMGLVGTVELFPLGEDL